jgi:hypothetical protein
MISENYWFATFLDYLENSRSLTVSQMKELTVNEKNEADAKARNKLGKEQKPITDYWHQLNRLDHRLCGNPLHPSLKQYEKQIERILETRE